MAKRLQLDGWTFGGNAVTAPVPDRPKGSYERFTIASRINHPVHCRIITKAPQMLELLEQLAADLHEGAEDMDGLMPSQCEIARDAIHDLCMDLWMAVQDEDPKRKDRLIANTLEPEDD